MKYYLFLVPALVVLITGCPWEPQHGPVYFRVKVDSIAHTPSGAPGDTLTVALYGVIGTDGCSAFAHFDIDQQPSSLDLVVWGRRWPNDVCAAVVVSLDGKEYRWIAARQGWFLIAIHQPDGGVLRDSILIR